MLCQGVIWFQSVNKFENCSELVSKKMEEASSDSSLYQLVKPMGHKKLLYKVIFDEIRNIPGRTYFVQKKVLRLDGLPNFIHEVFIPDDPLEWSSCNNRKLKF